MNKNTFHEKKSSILENINSTISENCFFYEKLPYEQPKLLSIYEKLPFKIIINQDGSPILFDLKKNILSSKEAHKKKKEFSLEIDRFLQDSCYEINSKNLSIEKFYLLSPPPTIFKKYKIKTFKKNKPEFPSIDKPFFLTKIFLKKRVEDINKLNSSKIEIYKKELKKWEEEKEEFLIKETKEEIKWNYLLWNDPSTMKEVFYKNLLKNRFPLSLAFEMQIEEEGKKILFNLIILNKNEILKKEASFDKKEKKIKLKKTLEEKEALEKNLGSLLFFFISNIFHSLPNSDLINIKASNKQEILLELMINRKNWEGLHSEKIIEDFALEALNNQFKAKPLS